MSWDKDWEVYLALQDPNSSLHYYLDEQMRKDASGQVPEEPTIEEMPAVRVQRGSDLLP